MSEKVRFVVLINPNNPTGNVATPDEVDAMLRIVKAWPQCMIIADEIYDGLDFTGHHVSVASRSSDVPVVTLNGVSSLLCARLAHRLVRSSRPFRDHGSGSGGA